MHAVLRFEELLNDPELRRTLASDPIVDTTLDLALQREVSWLAWDTVRRLERRGAGNAAVLVVDRGSCRKEAVADCDLVLATCYDTRGRRTIMLRGVEGVFTNGHVELRSALAASQSSWPVSG